MYEPFVDASVVAATYKKLSEAHLAQLRYKGQGPVYYNPTPRTILYKLSEVDKWIEASARLGTYSGGELSGPELKSYRDSLETGEVRFDH